MRLIFDAHLDLALFALAYNRDQTETVAQINEREAVMTDVQARGGAVASLPEMRRGGVAVCQSTVAVRADREVRPAAGYMRTDLDFATQEMAYAYAQGQLAYYRVLERQGEIKLIGTVEELAAHWRRWEAGVDEALPVGIIVSMECADPIVEPTQAQAWWEDGVRSVSLAHFGVSHYAHGTGTNGPLTERGVELLKEFERIGMILDLTHTADDSFYQALDCFGGPVLASHTNCRALVPGDRQFADEQIQLLIQRGGVIGAARGILTGTVLRTRFHRLHHCSHRCQRTSSGEKIASIDIRLLITHRKNLQCAGILADCKSGGKARPIAFTPPSYGLPFVDAVSHLDFPRAVPVCSSGWNEDERGFYFGG